jgi:hypothetical protein
MDVHVKVVQGIISGSGKLQAVNDGGVPMILAEFGAEDVLNSVDENSL